MDSHRPGNIRPEAVATPRGLRGLLSLPEGKLAECLAVAPPPHRADALAPILDRRFERYELEVVTADVFTPAAVAILEAVYHDGARHDYRRVFRAAQSACTVADRRGAAAVDGPDVKQALESL